MGLIEFRRVISEWKQRFQRVAEIIAPPTWNESDWQVFSCSLAILIQKHGTHWIHGDNKFWDLRWNIKDGGQLVCQIEQKTDRTVSVIVAQEGGFAGNDSYTWLWAELDTEGQFIEAPYFVEGTWKDALVALLIPFSNRAGFYLGDRAETPDTLMISAGSYSAA